MEDKAPSASFGWIRPVVYASAAILLLGLGALGGRASLSATTSLRVQRVPFPAECEKTWNQLKISIEGTTDAKVRLVRFTRAVDQYPNLVGFVEITGVDKIDSADLRIYTDTAIARCYASTSSAISLRNPQFGRLFELVLSDTSKSGNSPIYATLEKDQIVLRYNEPLW